MTTRQFRPRLPFKLDLNSLTVSELVEMGLKLVDQNLAVEAGACFEIALDKLSPNDAARSAILAKTIKNIQILIQAQNSLMEASKRLAQAIELKEASLLSLEVLFVDQEPEIPLSDSIFDAFPPSLPVRPPSNGFQTAESRNLPSLHITLFGTFQVLRGREPVSLCSSRNGQILLRYLASHPQRKETADVLMGVLWPEDSNTTARRKLQVAVSALRASLHSGLQQPARSSYIICKNEIYMLNPEAEIKVDTATFLELYQAGKQAVYPENIPFFESACRLRKGIFLFEDLYSDWTQIRRELLTRAFLSMCTVLAHHYLKVGQFEEVNYWSNALLEENPCDETAHRLLIQNFLAAGRRPEALQQYLRCQKILERELGVGPLPETRDLILNISANFPK